MQTLERIYRIENEDDGRKGTVLHSRQNDRTALQNQYSPKPLSVSLVTGKAEQLTMYHEAIYARNTAQPAAILTNAIKMLIINHKYGVSPASS